MFVVLCTCRSKDCTLALTSTIPFLCDYQGQASKFYGSDYFAGDKRYAVIMSEKKDKIMTLCIQKWYQLLTGTENLNPTSIWEKLMIGTGFLYG